METLLVLIVLACVWFFFVGLPVLGLYFVMRGQYRQGLDHQRRQFERLLRDVETRDNRRDPCAAGSTGTRCEPSPQQSSSFPETSQEHVFQILPPVVTVSESPDLSTNKVLPPVSERLTEKPVGQEASTTSGVVLPDDQRESPKDSPLLPPSFQGSGVFSQVESPVKVTATEHGKETISPTVADVPNNNMTDDNIYGIRMEDSVRPSSGSYGLDERARAKQETHEVTQDELTLLELQIGRKLFGWLAVGLFVLAGAFFVQLAISYGWLKSQNRFVGMVLAGAAILIYGRHLFRIGWRRYSEMLNSAGIVTLFSAAYYAMFVRLFSPTISSGLLVATILGGFLLSAAYRSIIIGYVATFGGLLIPLLIKLGPDSLGLVFYLSILNLAVIMLINILGRSHLALISWVGTPVLMIYFWEQNGQTIQYAQSGLLFYSIFLLLYLVDTFLAVCRTTRRIGTNDVIRALLTPIIFFGGCRTILVKTENLVLCNLSGQAFFDRFGCWVVLGLAAIALVAALVSARRNRRSDMIPDRNAAMTGVLLVVVFVFLGMFMPLALKSSVVAVGWLAIAVGLLAMSTSRYNLFFFASVPNEPEKLARRGSEPSAQMQHYETGYLLFWSFVFFTLGASRLVLSDFLPNWAPVHIFRGGGHIFIHPLVAPITCSCALLVAGMIFVRHRVKSLSRETAVKTDSKTDSHLVRSSLTVLYGVVGLVVFILLTCSESYSWTVASTERWNWSIPALFGWGAVLYVLTGISLAAFLWGYVRNSSAVRASSLGLLALVATKVTLIDVVFHPIIAQQLPSMGGAGDLSTLSTHVFLIGNMPIPKYTLTVVNPFVLPLLLCAGVMMFVGIVIRQQSNRTQTDRQQFNHERGLGLSLGIWGLALLWVLASLECVAWCEYRPQIYGDHSFYTAHLLIVFWTLANCVILAVGAWARSRAIRRFVYSTLLLQLPFVAWAEFCGMNWRPETIRWPLINWDALPVLAFSVFLMATGVWLTRMAREVKQGERLTGAWLGSTGIIYTWLLLSFELFRFCSGKEWFGPGDWTHLIALSLLWGFMITSLAIAGVKRNSTLLRLLAMGLMFVLAGKVLLCELSNRGEDFFWPVVNSYAVATYGASIFIIVTSCTLHSIMTRVLRQTQDHKLGMKLELELYGWRWLSLIGLAFGWFASSVDVYQSADNVPLASHDSQQIIAQMSLSVLWSCFAGLLLFLGFRQKSSLLRWLAISMFGLTTIKVMTVDLHQVDQIWRVVAFFVLAIALAIAAGAYQRFKPVKEKSD